MNRAIVKIKRTMNDFKVEAFLSNDEQQAILNTSKTYTAIMTVEKCQSENKSCKKLFGINRDVPIAFP